MPAPRTLSGFAAAGAGGGTVNAVVDGAWQSGWTALGVGTLVAHPAPGARSSEFAATGVSAMAAWPDWHLQGFFTAEGTGALTMLTKVGGDDLIPVGPNLAATDALRIGVVLHGLVELFSPEDLTDDTLGDDTLDGAPADDYTQTVPDDVDSP